MSPVICNIHSQLCVLIVADYVKWKILILKYWNVLTPVNSLKGGGQSDETQITLSVKSSIWLQHHTHSVCVFPVTISYRKIQLMLTRIQLLILRYRDVKWIFWPAGQNL